MPASLYRTSAFGPAIPPRLVSGGAALFANGTGTAQFDHLRVTQYPDPSASLASARRATSSVVNWNANVPSGTSLNGYTSLDDGATYQPATSATDIAGISTLLHGTLVQQIKPACYLRLEETSGITANDSSGNGNNGNINNDGHGNLVGVSLGATGALQGPGETTSTAMTFDGLAGYISLPSSVNPAGWANFSVGFWIKPTVLTGFKRILSNDNTSSDNKGFEIILDGGSDQSIQFALGNGTTFAQAFTTSATAIGVWTYFVATYDGTTLRTYYNGKAQGTASLSGTIAAGTNVINIGRNPAYNGDFVGAALDEVFIVNFTLSASDVAAIYNSGLASIGQSANDSFTADTHTSYTQTFGSGGSGATWTWDTAGSKLNAVGGNKAHLLYNNLWAYDIDLLGDFLQAENSGFIWGYQDNLNYYTLNIKDGQASVGANTVTLFKTVAGTATQLATANITWQVVSGGITNYQIHHRFHMTMLSGVITVFMDETQILTYTDSSPFPAGLAGLRNDTGTSYIYLLQITPQPVDLSSKFIVSKHVLTTTSPTVTPQITDHQAWAGDSTFGVGSLINEVDYRSKMVSDNIDDLNTQSGYWWRIDDSLLKFTPRNASNSPWILQSTDVLINSLPTVEYSGDMYRNRQRLTGVFDTGVFPELKNGDGQTRTWNVSYPIVAPPTILLNEIAVSIGIQGTDTGKQFYYQLNSPSITQDNSGTILQSTDVLSITYTGSFGIDFYVDNSGQIPNTISQAQMAARDGTSGITEAVEDVSQRAMNKAAATIYANQLLSKYGTIGRTIKFDTLHNGLKVGHSLPVFIPQLNIFDSVFLIVETSIKVRTIGTPGGTSIQYVNTITASEAASLASWQKLFSRVLRSVSGTKPGAKA